MLYREEAKMGYRLCGLNLSSAASLTALALGIVGASGAAAQTTVPETAVEAGAEADIVVTAQKREEKLQKVPISITAISGAALESSSFEGVSDALNAVPGVTTTDTYLGGGTNIVVRGVGASFPLFAGPSTVAYYLDSVPFGLVKSAIGPDANVYDLERVEVLRGPQGTLYGSSALNGVVRILTHEPELGTFDMKGRGLVSSTEHGGESFGGDLTLNVPIIEDRLAIRGTVSYQDNAGWIDQPNRRDVNRSKVQTYRFKLLAKPTERLSIGLYSWVSRSDAGAPDLGFAWDQSESLVHQPVSSDYDALGLRLTYDADAFSVTSMTSYLDYQNVGRLGLDVPFFSIDNGLYYSQTDAKTWSQEINVNSSGTGPWRWSVGGLFRHATEDLFQHFDPLLLPDIQYYDKSRSYAVYGQVTRLLFDDRLEITGGLRYYHDRITQRGRTAPTNPFRLAETKASATTPRLVVTWHPNEQSTFYASYSQGFRSGFPQTPAVLEAAPNFPAAGPDRLHNYEVGAKGNLLGGAIGYDVSLYHIDWKRIQLQLGLLINGFPYVGIINGASAKGNGIDAALIFRPARGFTISPYVSWNDLEIARDVFDGTLLLYARGDRPANSPKLTAGISSELNLHLGEMPVKLSASASYVTEQSYRAIFAGEVLVQTSDRLFNARASAAFDLTDQLTATLFASNITNERGRTAVMFPGLVPNWDARMRPRTIGLQIEYRMGR
jgi:outer membrane receptor protein involved in Fe transport